MTRFRLGTRTFGRRGRGGHAEGRRTRSEEEEVAVWRARRLRDSFSAFFRCFIFRGTGLLLDLNLEISCVPCTTQISA